MDRVYPDAASQVGAILAVQLKAAEKSVAAYSKVTADATSMLIGSAMKLLQLHE